MQWLGNISIANKIVSLATRVRRHIISIPANQNCRKVISIYRNSIYSQFICYIYICMLYNVPCNIRETL